MTDTRTPGTPTKRSGLWGPGLWLLGRFGDGGRRFGLAGLLLLILVGVQTWRWSVLPPQVGGALVAGVDLWLVLLGIDTLAGLGVAYVLLSSRQVPQGHLRALQRRLQLLAAGDLTAAAASPVSGPLAGVMADLQDRLTALRQDARAVSAGLDAAAQELHADAAGLVPWSARTAALARTCGTTGERLAAAARQAVSQLDDTAAQALQAAALAEEGRQALHDMVARMGRMRSTSTDITAVAGAIDALTLQTHLLALNASVEASRAGAHGAGFGVIADEVRRLARHSQEAAGQIQALVMATLHEVELGEECVRRTGLTIDSVVAASQGVADQVSAASGAAVTQCVGLGETASILVEVGQRTAYQARQAERTLTTAQDLCAGTAALSAQVSRWQLPAGAST